MIKTTTWRPDTCGCELEYTWDSESDPSTRVHTGSNIVTVCALHQGMDTATHYSTVSEHNTRKNKIRAAIETNFPSLFNTVTASDGSTSLTLKPQYGFAWKYDENHVLTITLSGFTTNQKNTAQTWCNNNLGAGKVVIA